MMPDDRWCQVKALFASAVDRPVEERSSFLDAACRDDAALRQEVEALLAADAQASSFIERPALVFSTTGTPQRMPGATNAPSLRPGDCLGPYELVEFVGAGGMGEVYKARDTRLGRHAAIKILLGADVEDAMALERFDREARAASALNHPNIVTIYDVGRAQSECGSVAYIAMELVEGRTLRHLFREGALAIDQFLDLAVQIADALAAAHRHGVVHRDLKPENIVVSREGRAKILDFGLATIVVAGAPHGSAVLPKTAERSIDASALVGTAAYMSPQQAMGMTVDFRSDQFSFGAMLYEMVTGTQAFGRDTLTETLAAIVRLDVEPIGRAAPELPAPLQWIVSRCLAQNPEHRYGSSDDLARELHDRAPASRSRPFRRRGRPDRA